MSVAVRLQNQAAGCFVPGEIFGSRPVEQMPPEDAEVEEDVYRRLKIMSVSLEGGYENNKKLN